MDGGIGLSPRATAERTNAIQKFFIGNSRLGIPVIFHEECLHGHAAIGATGFPQPIALGGTFDPALVESLYAMTAVETRVRGAHQALTPVVDVARDPRWGRVQETYGEDPFLNTQLGMAAGLWIMAGLYGYNTKAAPTRENLLGFRMLSSVHVGILFGVCTLLLIACPINKRLTIQISNQLAERREKSGPQTV